MGLLLPEVSQLSLQNLEVDSLLGGHPFMVALGGLSILCVSRLAGPADQRGYKSETEPQKPLKTLGVQKVAHEQKEDECDK